jgi:hypothetical protein
MRVRVPTHKHPKVSMRSGIRACTLAATGPTDREVAERLRIAIHTIRCILISPLYRGPAARWILGGTSPGPN